MKTKMGRGGNLNNQKNMSTIRCQEETYSKPYPKVVKARHMKLEIGGRGNRDSSFEGIQRRSSLKKVVVGTAFDLTDKEWLLTEPSVLKVKVSNEAPKNMDNIGKDLFQPRRNLSKSYDFTSSNRSKQADS
jgi:hypothetical protein